MIKQICFELKKIIKSPQIFFSIVGLLLVCGIFFECKIEIPELGSGFSTEGYHKIVKELKGSSGDKVYKRVSDSYKNMMQGIAETEIKYEKNYSRELNLYGQVIKEFGQSEDYPKYVQTVLDNSQKAGISLFDESDGTQREQEKVQKDFQKMTETKPHFLGTYAVEMYMKTDLWDLAVVAIVMILVHSCILAEVEENKICLLRCTKNGRAKTAYAKFISGSVLLFCVQFIMYVLRFVLAGIAYRFPKFTEAFQSVLGTSGCTLKISIGQAMLLVFILKVFVTIVLFAVFFTAALLLRNTWKFYIIGLGIMAVSWILFSQIDANSFLAILKWLNPAAFLAVDSIISDYRNLMIFGYPIGYMPFVLIVCAMFLEICICTIGKLYCNVMPFREKSGLEKIFALRECIAGRLLGGHGLWGYECRKWSFYQKGIWFCVFYMIIGFIVYQPVSERLFTKEEIYYKYYVKQVEGKYTEEKMKSLYAKEKKLSAINKKIEKNGGKYTGAVIAYYSRQLEKEPGLKKVVAYGKYLNKNGGDFIYEQGYHILFGKGDGKFALFLCRCASLMLMALLSVLIWYIEQTGRMNCLIRISTCGTKKTDCYKYGNVMLSGMIVAVITYIPWVYNVFSVFGCAGLSSPANSLQMFFRVPVWIPLSAVIIAFFVLHMLYLWAIGFITKVLSRVIKNGLVAAVLLFGFGILPILLLWV